MKKTLYILTILLFAGKIISAGQIISTTYDEESGNTAVYNTDTKSFTAAALGQADNDVVVETDGENIYFLSRGLGSIAKYAPDQISATGNVTWQYSVGTSSNPHDIVFLDSKAYVIRYGEPSILIVNQNATSQDNFELGTIDISSFDENGVPEATHGFVYNNKVYVVIQRLNGWTADKSGYLIAIDPTTDTLIDLDQETDGVQGMELLVKNPQWFSQVGPIAYISGHDWAGQTEGVQTVDLGDNNLTQTMLLDEETLSMDITGISVLDESYGIIFTPTWTEDCNAYWFNPSTGVVGDALPVPTPEGGAVMVDDIIYVGSQDGNAPGIYPLNPTTNTLVEEAFITTLKLYSMVYIGDDIPTVVAETGSVPESFTLAAPYPNPFNPATTISFSLPFAGMVAVDVYNPVGQHVATLAHDIMSAGHNAVVWNAENLSNGMYIITVRQGNITKVTKATLVK